MENNGSQNKYTSNLPERAYFCLDLDCKLERRMCSEELSEHYQHLAKCMTISFLKTIAENSKQKLQLCTQIETASNIKQKIDALLDRVNQFNTSLDNEIYDYEVISQLLICYHGLIEDEIINILYSELPGMDEQFFIETKNKMTKIFNFESVHYLIQKFTDYAFVLTTVQNFEGAIQNYKLALELISNEENEMKTNILEQMYQISILSSQNQISNQQSIIKPIPQKMIQQQKQEKQRNNQLLANIFLTMSSKPCFVFFSDQIELFMTFIQQKDIQQGLLLLLFNHNEQALLYFSEKIKHYGFEQRVDICYVYALILIYLKKEKELFELLQSCVKINQLFKPLQIFMFMLYEHFNEARAMLLQNLDSNQDQRCQNLSLFYCIFVHDYCKALEETQNLLTVYPNNEILSYMKIQLSIQLNKYHLCWQDIESIQDNFNFRKTILKLRLKQQYENALKLIDIKQQYEAMRKEELEADKIICLYEMGKYEVVSNLIEEILLCCCDHINMIRVQLIKSKNHCQLVLNNFQLHQFSQAVYDLDEFANKFNFKNKLQIIYLNGEQSDLFLGKLLFKLKKYDNSIKCFNQYCEKYNYSIQAYVCIATIQCYKGEYQEAVRLFDYALNLNESYYPAIYNKAIALFQSKNYEQAQQCFLLSQSHYPRSYLMIVLCKLLTKNNEIEVQLSLLHQLKKYQKYSFLLRIAAYIVTENYEKAQVLIEQYYANYQLRKSKLYKLVWLSQSIEIQLTEGIIQFKTQKIESLQNLIFEIETFEEFQPLAQPMREYKDGAQNDESILEGYLQSIKIIKYDTKEFNMVPGSIELLHCQIDFESFANYIRIVFD